VKTYWKPSNAIQYTLAELILCLTLKAKCGSRASTSRRLGNLKAQLLMRGTIHCEHGHEKEWLQIRPAEDDAEPQCSSPVTTQSLHTPSPSPPLLHTSPDDRPHLGKIRHHWHSGRHIALSEASLSNPMRWIHICSHESGASGNHQDCREAGAQFPSQPPKEAAIVEDRDQIGILSLFSL
jgi:hypothetical protein